MQENTKNVFVGLLVVIFVAFLVGLFVWGMTRFSLGKQISHLSQEKSKLETIAKDKEQEKETAVQKTVEQYKALLSKFEKDVESTKTGCQTGYSVEDIQKKEDRTIIENVFSDKRISDQISNITSITWCRVTASSLSSDIFHAFVMNGTFGKDNNIVGYVTEEGNMILDTQNSKYMEDAGVCGVSGFIDENLLYACAGGKSGGFSSWYVLRKDTQKSVLLKSCTYVADRETNQTKCEKNILNLAQ